MTDIEKSEAFRTIQNALVPMVPLTLRFQYTDAKGEITSRHVEPYELRGETLYAHCLDRDALRQFKIGQMTEVMVGHKFKPRHPIVIPV
jgi:predicted DNA-binding transcriptional regulator YafY